MQGQLEAAMARLDIVPFAQLRLSRRPWIRSTAAGILPAWLAGEFHDHGSHSVQAGLAVIRPRLHRPLGGEFPKAVLM
jgi:hypothetical protein